MQASPLSSLHVHLYPTSGIIYNKQIDRVNECDIILSYSPYRVCSPLLVSGSSNLSWRTRDEPVSLPVEELLLLSWGDAGLSCFSFFDGGLFASSWTLGDLSLVEEDLFSSGWAGELLCGVSCLSLFDLLCCFGLLAGWVTFFFDLLHLLSAERRVASFPARLRLVCGGVNSKSSSLDWVYWKYEDVSVIGL